jgi:hypothetical protein
MGPAMRDFSVGDLKLIKVFTYDVKVDLLERWAYKRLPPFTEKQLKDLELCIKDCDRIMDIIDEKLGG